MRTEDVRDMMLGVVYRTGNNVRTYTRTQTETHLRNTLYLHYTAYRTYMILYYVPCTVFTLHTHVHYILYLHFVLCVRTVLIDVRASLGSAVCVTGGFAAATTS